jgi:thioredoxin-related protein
MLNRRRCLTLLAQAAVLAPLATPMIGLAAPATKPQPPLAANLKQDGDRALAAQIPLLLFFTQTHCPFCHRARKEFLGPMSLNADYAQKTLIREIDTERRSLITTFSGDRISSTGLAQRYGVRVYPTVVLVDGTGKLMGKPIEGLLTTDFYGYYLDEAISDALRQLRPTDPAQRQP